MLLGVRHRSSFGRIVAASVGLAVGLAGCGGSHGSESLRWSSPAAVTKGFDLLFVSCPSSAFCVGLGDTDRNLSLRTITWNGSRWKDASPGPNLNPPGVGELSCGSPTFCLAINSSDAWQWNGKEWSKDLPPPGSNIQTSAPGLNVVSCASQQMCMAVSDTNQAFRFEKGRWDDPVSLPALPPGSQAPSQEVGLADVSCPTATSCTAIEANGFEFTWNGHTWQAPLDALPPGNEYVSCPEVNWCMFMNSQSYEAIQSGNQWSGPPSFVDAESMDVGQPSGETSAVSWGQANYGVLDLSCGSPTMCVAVDDAGYAVSFNGQTWSKPANIATWGDNLETVTCVTSLCMAVNDFMVIVGRFIALQRPKDPRPQHRLFDLGTATR
jgi:hypothetical protein